MSTSLLTTKFYFPKPVQHLVLRARLVDRLQEGIKGPLTVISAPAGYGKTTLLSQWRETIGASLPAAWLSLDPADNDPGRFLEYLTAAIETTQPDLTKNTRRLLSSTELPSTETIGTMLLNDFAAANGEFILILDDYHLLTNTEIHQLVSFLLNHSLHQMHIVILTRADPPLPLARLRASGRLAEIRAADLRFSIAEAACFFRDTMGLALGEQDLSALEARTEGWIAGLQLAALSMKGREDADEFIRTFSGSHRYIMDYLVEEVLNRQPKLVQEFLLKTSILERLTGLLCDAVTGQNDGQFHLESLAASNLFVIPLDDERRWYRYHHLFADLLRNRLHQTLSTDEMSHLHRSASLWLDQNNLYRESLEHAIAGGDHLRAALLLSEHFVAIAGKHRLPEFIRWMDQIPEPILSSIPRLCITKAYVMGAQGKTPEVDHYIRLADEALAEMVISHKISDQAPEYIALLAEIRCNQAGISGSSGDFEVAIKHAEEALTLAPEDAYFIRGLTLLNLVLAYREVGRFDDAIKTSQQAITISQKSKHPGIIADSFTALGLSMFVKGQIPGAFQVLQEGLSYARSQGYDQISIYSPVDFLLASLFLMQNQLETAEQYIQQGLEISRSGGRALETIQGLILKARIQIARNEWLHAQDTLVSCLDEQQRSGITQHHSELTYLNARVRAEFGNITDAAYFIESRTRQIGSQLGYAQAKEALAYAHLLIRLGDFQHAEEFLHPALAVIASQGCLTWQVEVLVLLAVCLLKQNEPARAKERLTEALLLAAPHGLQRFFLDEGQTIRDPLREIAASPHDDRVTRFIQALLLEIEAQHPIYSPPRQPILEPLSDRELEVLGLIADGLSNKEVANSLVIAVGTVKRHTVNIFTKLDAKNRTDAVAKARALGIL